MAKFRLRFIIPNNDNTFVSDLNEEESYISSLITDFDSQQNIYKNNQD